MRAHMIESIKRKPIPPITRSSKVEIPLPPGKFSEVTILVSGLEDPRITIKNSEWATRAWTYQEGVLSNRRLVFTEQQMHWECNGMATNETGDLVAVRMGFFASSMARRVTYLILRRADDAGTR